MLEATAGFRFVFRLGALDPPRLITIVMPEKPGNLVRRKHRRLERAGIWIAMFGVALLAVGGAYDIWSYRASPRAPDTTHSVLQEAHGDARYKTPSQVRTFRCLNVAGVSMFAIGAALLIICNRMEKSNA